MTREECAKCLTVLRVNYQSFARNMKQGDAEAVLTSWEVCFKDEPYELVSMAIYDLIQTKKDFAPDIAAIKERIREMFAVANNEPTKEELWNILKCAASRSAYNAVEEYKKLPPILQQYIGNPEGLYTLSQTDAETVDTVQRGIFLKNIENIKAREDFHQRLNPEMRQMLQGISGKKMLPNTAPAPLMPEQVNNRRNDILKSIDTLEAPKPTTVQPKEYKPKTEEQCAERRRMFEQQLAEM